MDASQTNHSSAETLRQVVHSPDAVALELPLAGPASRMLAYAIDAAILYTTLFGLFALVVLTSELLDSVVRRMLEALGGLAGVEEGGAPSGPAMLVLAILVLVFTFADIAYFVLWETVNGGQSPGKRVMRLKVMCDGGLPLTFAASLTRNLLRVVDVLPSSYLTGLISMVVSREGKRLGDLGAGTIVVRLDRPAHEPPLAVDVAPDDAPFSFRRDQIARLGGAERALIRQTLRRLDRLPPEQASQALERSVEALRIRIGFEDPVEERDRPAFLRALGKAATRR